MKFLALDCLVVFLLVVVTELFRLGKASLTWVAIMFALAAGLQLVQILVDKEETEDE